MASFSEREGFTPKRNFLQTDSMDDALRNSLWNALTLTYWNNATSSSSPYKTRSTTQSLLSSIWIRYFKIPIDTLSTQWSSTFKFIRDYFMTCEWSSVYNFIEFISEADDDERRCLLFQATCNIMLEQELSGYRFVSGLLTRITSEEERASIERALSDLSPLSPIQSQLKQALSLMSDRKSPDYRNSIKESISAVEGLCNKITGTTSSTLGDALKSIERSGQVPMHSALKKSFEALYGYTSNADGIRHALLEEDNLDFDDAKYMLVSCSAFISYLIAKASKAGVTF